MAIHVSSQLITGDGAESAQTKGKITSVGSASQSNDYTVSNLGGNIMWMGGPPNVNQPVMWEWNGASGLPTVYDVNSGQDPSFIRIWDHFMSGWAEGNIDMVMIVKATE